MINLRFFTLLVVNLYTLLRCSSTRARSTYGIGDFYAYDVFSERHRRAQDATVDENLVELRSITKTFSDGPPSIWGFRVEKVDGKYAKTDIDGNSGLLTINADTMVGMRFFGENFSPSMQIALTSKNGTCSDDMTNSFRPDADDPTLTNTSALIHVTISIPGNENNGEFVLPREFLLFDKFIQLAALYFAGVFFQ